MDRLSVLALGVTLTLAGCFGGQQAPLSVQGGTEDRCSVTQPVNGGTTLELHCLDSQGPTSHQAARGCTGPDGSLQLDAVIDGGTLRVAVVDGDQAVVADQVLGAPYDGTALTRLPPAAPGTWTLTAQTSDGFDGAFRLALVCTGAPVGR